MSARRHWVLSYIAVSSVLSAAQGPCLDSDILRRPLAHPFSQVSISILPRSLSPLLLQICLKWKFC